MDLKDILKPNKPKNSESKTDRKNPKNPEDKGKAIEVKITNATSGGNKFEPETDKKDMKKVKLRPMDEELALTESKFMKSSKVKKAKPDTLELPPIEKSPASGQSTMRILHPQIEATPTIQKEESDQIKEVLLLPECVSLLKGKEILDYLGLGGDQVQESKAGIDKMGSKDMRPSGGKTPNRNSIKPSPSKLGTPAAGSNTRAQKFNNNKTSFLNSIFGIASQALMESRLKHYLYVAIFLSCHFNLRDHIDKMLTIFRTYHKDHRPLYPNTLLEDTYFLELILSVILEQDESELYKLLLSEIKDLNILLVQSITDLFVDLNKLDSLVEYFANYNKYLKANKPRKEVVLAIESQIDPKNLEDGRQSDETSAIPGLTLNRAKVIFLVKTYFQCTDENNLLMSILRHLGLSFRSILGILLDTYEEERIIRIVNENYRLAEYLDQQVIRDRKMFKLLILFHKMELIIIFNQRAHEENFISKITIYQELCNRIQKGKDVEAYVNVITEVSETFWDMPKFYRFYECLKKLIASKSNWMVEIKNPLLFFMTLIKFFKDIKEQLDYKNNEINALVHDMTNFCLNYIDNASEEVFMLNLFDRDNKGKGFLDYAFEVANMTILEKKEIESLLFQMWDQGRHTLQTIEEFMRIGSMDDGNKKFSLSVFTKKYETPIEEGDSFQLEFLYASNSTKLRVCSEIVWTIPIILIEFIFSMHIIQQRLNNTFNSNWITVYYESQPSVMVIHLFLRISHIISCLIKGLAIKKITDEAHFLSNFYFLLLTIDFLQFVIMGIFFASNFWFLNVTQMLRVLILAVYMLFNALSLNEIGVYIRIFARMALVVVVFGTVSFSIITAIAYTIHVIFISYTQPILGQFYPDLNLFNDLYQGIMTLFEFVFGAVVLVRDYPEQNYYTYAMTFIMTMFSFFGNIMLANMLVAFLTSQFEAINTNAKYLTMNMQYGLVKIYRYKDLDTVFSLPFWLVIPALPVYSFMLKRNSQRNKANLLLRKIIHIVNIFIPTFILMNVYEILMMVWRYLTIGFRIFTRILVSPINALYLPCWLLAGPFLLLKLWIQDIITMCVIMLDFSKGDQELMNFELADTTRGNLIKIFLKMSRAISHETQHSKVKVLSVKKFVDMVGIMSVADVISDAFYGRGNEDEDEEVKANTKDTFGLDLNAKYCLEEGKILKILISRYATRSKGRRSAISKDNFARDYILDLELMQKKFKNNINVENIGRLISFEKSTIDLANKFFAQSAEDSDDEDKVAEKDLKRVHDSLTSAESNMTRLIRSFEQYRQLAHPPKLLSNE